MVTVFENPLTDGHASPASLYDKATWYLLLLLYLLYWWTVRDTIPGVGPLRVESLGRVLMCTCLRFVLCLPKNFTRARPAAPGAVAFCSMTTN
jgi:hypothetical protein